jgi:hypothetical protein
MATTADEAAAPAAPTTAVAAAGETATSTPAATVATAAVAAAESERVLRAHQATCEAQDRQSFDYASHANSPSPRRRPAAGQKALVS